MSIPVNIFVLLAASMAQADVVIDFNDLPGDTSAWSGDRYQSLGVVFSTSSNAFLGSQDSALTSSNFIYGSTGPGADSIVAAEFINGPSNYVGFHVTDTEDPFRFWTAEIFDAQGNLLDSLTRNTGDANETDFHSFTLSSFTISRFVFTPSDDYEGIDNFTFNIPAPSGVSLMALSGVLSTRRRR